MKSKLQKINFWFLVILIAFIPLQALLSGILEYHFGHSFFWQLHWYEPILILLLLISIALNPRIERPLGFNIISLFTIGIISTLLYQFPSIGLEGFRFSLIGVLFLILAYLAEFSTEQKKGLLRTYLFMSSLVALWALIEKFLPGKYWNIWGVLPTDLYWGYGWHLVGDIKQVASVIGGPNQLASYLLPVFFITLFLLIKMFKGDKSKFVIYLALLLLFGLVIFMTFSRSAMLGLLFPLLVVPWVFGKDIWLKRAALSIAVFMIAIFSFLYITGNELVTHGKSQAGHAEAMTEGFTEIANRFSNNQIQFMLGSGLGSAGPLSIKYGRGLISESWYLQLFLEIGLIGVLLWLLFIGLILLRLYENKNYSLFFGLIAVSITALFLHTWADNQALSYSLFILLGISLNKGSTKWQEF